MENKCQKAGVIYLTSRRGETIAMETNCKTRSCVPCQPRVKARLTMLVEYGLLTLSPSYFITFTFKAGEALQRHAPFVRASWRKVLDWLRPQYPNLAFLYVVELTKKNQPHLHVLMNFGATSFPRATCTPKATYDKSWLARDCNCLEHRLSHRWRIITGDSYVVDCAEVGSARNAASYLGKYFTKGLAFRLELSALGFKRSWAKSNTWPGDQLMLRETAINGWRKIEFYPGKPTLQERGWLARTEVHVLKERQGTDLAVALADRNAKEAMIRDFETASHLIGGP